MSVPATDTGREQFRIVRSTTTREVGDRVEREWWLDARPDLEWVEIFQLAVPPARRGPLEWVDGGNPDVIGAAIRWFVPSEQIEAADAEVRHRLTVANDRVSSEARPGPPVTP